MKFDPLKWLTFDDALLMVETSAWVNQTPNPDSFEMVASSSNNCINFLKLFLGGLFNPGKIWKNGQTKTIKC